MKTTRTATLLATLLLLSNTAWSLMGGNGYGHDTMKYEKVLLDQRLQREFRAPR